MLRQITSVTGLGLRSLPQRWGPAVVVIGSMTAVVGVLVSVLAMAHGFQRVFTEAGRDDRAVLLRIGDTVARGSAITREQIPIILTAPGIAADVTGKPLVTLQKFGGGRLPERKAGVASRVTIHGVGEQAPKIWPELRLTEGRWFRPGMRELIAGHAARTQFAGIELGQEVVLDDVSWKIVGIFEAEGSVFESELWADAEVVLDAYSVTGQFSSAVAVLAPDGGFETLRDYLTSNPALNHTAQREPEYYAQQTGEVERRMRMLGYTVAIIMAFGALFSAVNTMYAAVKARSVEIGTLRAIGFGGAPIVVSVLLEALVLCGLGALLGAGLAYLLFDGHGLSTMGGFTMEQVSFAFHVDSELVQQGLLLAAAVGLLGGLPPALRAARVPIVEALRIR